MQKIIINCVQPQPAVKTRNFKQLSVRCICTCRLAISRYMLCLAEVVIFPCGGHVLERLSTLKWLGDEEEVVRSEGKTKGVILALNSSVEEQLPAKSVVKGCKDPFFKKPCGSATARLGASKLGGLFWVGDIDV